MLTLWSLIPWRIPNILRIRNRGDHGSCLKLITLSAITGNNVSDQVYSWLCAAFPTLEMTIQMTRYHKPKQHDRRQSKKLKRKAEYGRTQTLYRNIVAEAAREVLDGASEKFQIDSTVFGDNGVLIFGIPSAQGPSWRYSWLHLVSYSRTWRSEPES